MKCQNKRLAIELVLRTVERLRYSLAICAAILFDFLSFGRNSRLV